MGTAEDLYEELAQFYAGMASKLKGTRSPRYREQQLLRLEGLRSALWFAAGRLGKDQGPWA